MEMVQPTPESLHRLRIDQVGSLLRPEDLKAAFAAHERGEITDDQLRQQQDRAIREAIRTQEAIGLPVITDGEFRRWQFQDSFSAAVSGFETRFAPGGTPMQPLPAAVPGARTDDPMRDRIATVARLQLLRNLPLEEFQFAQSVTPTPVKVTVLGAARILHRFDPERSRQIYASVDEFMADVVAIQRQIIGGLVSAGCRYIQVDEPAYTVYVDPAWIARIRSWGDDPDESLERAIRADNQMIAGFPDVTFGVHICRGNNRSMWHREGSYEPIAERLLTGLHHHRILLEYDSERAGTFAPLRFLPKDKTVVLGLVSTKFPELEAADGLVRRIEEASRYVSPDQIAISPQCGFASGIAGNLLTEADQWRKLELLVETARRLWG
jgi:5-methyltetrahydropteroyltriglutamate--homocysteine methyltransferase